MAFVCEKLEYFAKAGRMKAFWKVHLFSRMYKHFSSQKLILELLYVEGAIVRTPYHVKRCFCLITIF